jgi:hypothetical protein
LRESNGELHHRGLPQWSQAQFDSHGIPLM